MGMFDRVFVKCPECAEEVEFQSKAGDCTLDAYRVLDKIPPEIVKDINGDIGTCSKGHQFQLVEVPVTILVITPILL